MSRHSCILYKHLCRRFHTSHALKIDPIEVEEIKIPVPWGHVAGKWWGKKDVQPLIALHGRLDNANSWDPLVKIMPDTHPVLALDFPGSGLSSHFPPLQSYNFMDFVLLLQRTVLHYGFGPLTIIGHAGGSEIGFLYSALYPENVKGYCGIDQIVSVYRDDRKRAEDKAALVDSIITCSYEGNQDAEASTREDIRTMIAESENALSERNASILLRRGTVEDAQGIIKLARDKRLVCGTLSPLHATQAEQLAANISCHVTLVQANQSNNFDNCLHDSPSFLRIMKEKAKSFDLFCLDGGHYLHMDSPQQVLHSLKNFLDRCNGPE